MFLNISKCQTFEGSCGEDSHVSHFEIYRGNEKIIKQDNDKEKETTEILKEASILHDDLRNYGNLEEKK